MKNDIKIKNLLEKIENKKNEIGEKPRMTYNTNALFKYNDKEHFNLHTVNDPSILVRALSFLIGKCNLIAECSERLGVENEHFIWMGYTVDQWEGDFKNRIRAINWLKENKKMDDLTKQLKDLISEDGRTELALDRIDNLLQ